MINASRQRKLGVILRYINLILSNGIGLVLIPYMLRALGQEEFGLYQLVGSFIGYLTVLDFGMADTVIRYIAKYRAENDRKGEENFLATAYVIYLFIGAVVVLLGAIFYFSIPQLYSKSLTSHEIDQAQTMFVILILNLVLSLIGYPMSGVLMAYGQFVFPNLINVIKIILRSVTLFVVLALGGNAVAIVIVESIFNVAFFLSCTIFVLGTYHVRIKLYELQMANIREILFFSFFVFMEAIVNQIFWKMDQGIIGMFFDTAHVAVYAVGMQITMYYMSLTSSIAPIFLPLITQMEVQHASGSAFTDILIRTSRIQLTLLGIVLSGFILFGQTFIRLWAGPQYDDAYVVALIVMIPLTVPLVENLVLSSIMKAKRRHQFRAVLYLITAILNIPLTILLITQCGYIYAAASTAVMLFIGHILIMNWFYHSRIGIDVPRFFRETARGILPGIMIAMVLGRFIHVMSGQSWAALVMKTTLYIAVYGAILWFMGFNTQEKVQVRSLLSAFRTATSRIAALWDIL